MSQTLYFRTVYAPGFRERVRFLFSGRLAISATVYPKKTEQFSDVRAGIMPRSVSAEHWIATGERVNLKAR